MEYVYATLTLTETGAEINERNLTDVLEAAGADVVESRVKAIVAALEDVDLADLATEAGHEPAATTTALASDDSSASEGLADLDFADDEDVTEEPDDEPGADDAEDGDEDR